MSFFDHFTPKKATFRIPIINFGMDEEKRGVKFSPVLFWLVENKTLITYIFTYTFTTQGENEGKVEVKKYLQRHVRFAFNIKM
jgi:hypothetical protein